MNQRLREAPRALAVFAIGAAASFAMAFLFPRTWITDAFLWPGVQLLPFLGLAMPSAALYALVPEGGGAAALLVVLGGSLLTWGFASLLLAGLASRARSAFSRRTEHPVVGR